MKTFTFIALAVFASAIFNSCTADPEQWYTENIEVRAGDWKLVGPEDEIGSYFEYIFDGFPYVDGIINVYLYKNFGTSAEVQIPLPYTEYDVEILEDGSEKPYSIQYSYDIAVDGTIALKIHISDYFTRWFNPGTERFRVAIIYKE